MFETEVWTESIGLYTIDSIESRSIRDCNLNSRKKLETPSHNLLVDVFRIIRQAYSRSANEGDKF